MISPVPGASVGRVLATLTISRRFIRHVLTRPNGRANQLRNVFGQTPPKKTE
jgi:hypothetical protein